MDAYREYYDPGATTFTAPKHRSIDGKAPATHHQAKFAKAKARVQANVGTALKKLAK